MATTLTFTQAPHGAYPTNQSPVDAVIGNAVTVSNSTTTSGQYQLDDVPYGSTLPTGNLGPVGATSGFTPDVFGGYMLSLWVAGVRVAQLAIVAPDPDGMLMPPYGATGDYVDASGAVAQGNYRPTTEPTKGWKSIITTLRHDDVPYVVTKDVTAGNVALTNQEAQADILIAIGSPGATRTITFPLAAALTAIDMMPSTGKQIIIINTTSDGSAMNVVDPWTNTGGFVEGYGVDARWFPSASAIQVLFEGTSLHKVLDQRLGTSGTDRGALVMRSNGANWTKLSPGAAGTALFGQGPGADLVYKGISGFAGALDTLNGATTHQYLCADVSGNLTNSVGGAANPMAQTHAGGGSAGAFVSYQGQGLFHRGTYDVRFSPDLYQEQGDFFYASGESLAIASGYTVEAILQMDARDDSVAGRQCAVGLADTPGTNRLEIGVLGGYVYAFATNGTAIAWALAAVPSGERAHVMATITSGGALTLYVNGAPSVSNDGACVLGANFTRHAIGNTPLVVDAAANFAGFRGRTARVRLTPAVLTQAYASTATAAAGAL